MDLEFHQLVLRYERLRVQQPARERRLLASLAEAGQQIPIVVVIGGSAYVVVDGHKRVRCLRRLHRDTVAAVVCEMPEAEALIFRQLLGLGDSQGSLTAMQKSAKALCSANSIHGHTPAFTPPVPAGHGRSTGASAALHYACITSTFALLRPQSLQA
jgi:hypothetical protein